MLTTVSHKAKSLEGRVSKREHSASGPGRPGVESLDL